MTDVFISYANRDRDKVQALAHILQDEGLAVWWDRQLSAGAKFEDEIDAALRGAKAVLICWSRHSVASDWVRSEADDARRAGKLISIRFDGSAVPKPFDRYHVEDLSNWKGTLKTPAIERLIEAVRARVEGRAPKPVPLARQWLTRGAIVAFAMGLIAIAGWFSGIIQPLLNRAEIGLVRRDIEELRAELLARIDEAAAARAVELDEARREAAAAAIDEVLTSEDLDLAPARAALENGDAALAAERLMRLAQTQSGAEAAATYRRAGALWLASDLDKAAAAFASAVEADSDDAVSADFSAALATRRDPAAVDASPETNKPDEDTDASRSAPVFSNVACRAIDAVATCEREAPPPDAPDIQSWMFSGRIDEKKGFAEMTFDVAAEAPVLIQTFRLRDVDAPLALYNSNWPLRAANDNIVESEWFYGDFADKKLLAAGPYELRVFGDNEVGVFAVRIVDTPPADVFDLARASRVRLSEAGPDAGRLESWAAADVYRIELPRDAQITIDFEVEKADYTAGWTFLDPAGETIASDIVIDGARDFNEYVAPIGGVYTLRFDHKGHTFDRPASAFESTVYDATLIIRLAGEY